MSSPADVADASRKRGTTSIPEDSTSEPATKRAKREREGAFQEASLALTRGQLLLLSGNRAPCALATLSLASELLDQGAFEGASDLERERFSKVLITASEMHEKDSVEAKRRKDSDEAKGTYVNPAEIVHKFPLLQLQKWRTAAPQFKSVYHKLVHAEVFLPMGDIQLLDFDKPLLRDLLHGFSKSGYALSFVNDHYVFGVHCRPDGRFVVFDPHPRSFALLGHPCVTPAPAYLALLADAVDTSAFICDFVLSMRAGKAATEETRKVEIAAFAKASH